MARGRYSKLRILDGNAYETYELPQANRFREPDAFDGIRTFEYVTKRGDRLDHLAAKFLLDDRYYWVIALVNNLSLPYVTAGQRLKIPFDVTEVLDRL